jgi:hypothetical protein
VGSYYYLAAQLPYLVYGQALPISAAAFKALAAESRSAADAAVFEHCTLDHEQDKPSPSSFINRWKEWERVLRLNLARGRFQKLKREGSAAEAPDYPANAAAVAKTALTMESPLEAELFLDKARWDAIESFQGINTFSENAMYAYLLKLLLMERRAAFKTEEGFAEYKALYAAILGESK